MKYPTIKDLAEVIKAVKTTITDDMMEELADVPSLDLTVGYTPESGEWGYQTGDNSFTGGAYHHPNWAVVSIHRRSNSKEVAREIINQLQDLDEDF